MSAAKRDDSDTGLTDLEHSYIREVARSVLTEAEPHLQLMIQAAVAAGVKQHVFECPNVQRIEAIEKATEKRKDWFGEVAKGVLITFLSAIGAWLLTQYVASQNHAAARQTPATMPVEWRP